MTVDFYSADPDPSTPGLEDLDLRATPRLEFSKRESFGYSLNGKKFLVPETKAVSDEEKASYTVACDSFAETTARILDGYNTSTACDHARRPFTKLVAIGWTSATDDQLVSSRFALRGMADLGGSVTDCFVLSMSYAPNRTGSVPMGEGGLGLVTLDESGNWVKAVAKNCGGINRFIAGPWNSSYALGTYGVDAKTNSAWAAGWHWLRHG